MSPSRRIGTAVASGLSLFVLMSASPAVAKAVTRWRSRPLVVAGAATSSLGAVTCISEHACVAAGNFGFASGVSAPLVAREVGSKWLASRLPRPLWAEHSSLEGISCTSRTACMAVGSFFTWRQASIPLVERWNGARWQRLRLTTSAGETGASLNDVSCSAATSCTAVGESDTVGSTSMLIERWNGQTWSRQPLRALASSQLGGVVCLTGRSCLAVGTAMTPLPSGALYCNQAIATRWNGHTWSTRVVDQPAPSDCGFFFPTFDDVSCASLQTCTAVGGVGGDSAPDEPLAYGWNGAAWTEQNPAIPSDDGDLTRVSCTAAAHCTAVGVNGDSDGPFAEGLHSTGWSLQGTPSGGYMNDVSCLTAGSCVAVGASAAGQAAVYRPS
jgi:hypothetical protein